MWYQFVLLHCIRLKGGWKKILFVNITNAISIVSSVVSFNA